MKKYIIFNLVVLSLVAITLLWISFSRINDFKAYHKSIAIESTASASQNIGDFIKEKNRLVGIFGQEHLQIIKKLASAPEDGHLHQQLKERIALYFPEFFAFTITRADGTPYMEDFDGLIGDMCLSDLKDFASTNAQRTRIHPHPDVYHFDISTKLANGDNAIILFISFHTDILGSILSNAKTPGHQLMLINVEASNLLEVTDKGARNNTPRNDYRLTEAELQRILFSKKVPATRWNLSDLHDAELFSTFRRNILINYSLIFGMFLLVVMFMVLVIRREERLRVEAEKHKDDFLSVINHELRTPITSISGSLSLVANGVTGEINNKTQEMVDIALSNCQRLNLLINDLLDIKKYEAGKMELHRQSTRLDTFVKSCIESHQGYADKFNVRFQLQHVEANLIACIDQNRFAQAIANLLSNAAKYGAEQDTIYIDVIKHGANARISVTDHGKGIPESFRNRIFQKFSQSSIEHHKGGTGLGLSIVKMIAEAHGGSVSFENHPGQGTSFFIDVPIQA